MLSVLLSVLSAFAVLVHALPLRGKDVSKRIIAILFATTAALTIQRLPSLLNASDLTAKICYSFSFPYRILRASNGIIDLDAWFAVIAVISIKAAAHLSGKKHRGKAIFSFGAILFALLAFNFSFPINNASTSILSDRLKGIDQQIRIQWHRSSSYAAFNPHAVQIEQILCTIDKAGGDKIDYSIVQAEINSHERMLAEPEILPVPQQLLSFPSPRPVYSSLAIELNGVSRVISPVTDPELVYYEIIAAIEHLSSIYMRKALPAVCVVYGGNHSPLNYPYVAQAIASGGYNVVETDEMPVDTRDYSLILLIGTSRMTEQDVLNLHEFVKRGGKAIINTTAHNISFDNGWFVEENAETPIDLLLDAYGIRIEKGLVRDQRCFFMTLPELDGKNVVQGSYEFWPTAPLIHNSFTAKTSRQMNIQFFWPSHLAFNPESHSNLLAVIASSRRANIEPTTAPIDPLTVFNGNNKSSPRSGESFTFAVRTVDYGLLVIADELFLSSMTDYTASSNNFEFLRDSVDAMLGKPDLIALKKNPLRISWGFPRQKSITQGPIVTKKQIQQTEKISLLYPGTNYETLLLKNADSDVKSTHSLNVKEASWDVSIHNELVYSGNAEKITRFISDLTRKRVKEKTISTPSFDSASNYCVITLYGKNDSLIEQIEYYAAYDGFNSLFYYPLNGSHASSPDALDDSVFSNAIEWTERYIFAAFLGHTGIAHARLSAPDAIGKISLIKGNALASLTRELTNLRSIDITNMPLSDPFVLNLDTDALATIEVRFEQISGEYWHIKIGNNAAGWIVSSTEIDRILSIFKQNER